MTPERWQRITQLFHDALRCNPTERHEFLVRHTGSDAGLLDEVQSLLQSHQQADGFLSQAASPKMANLLRKAAGGDATLKPGESLGDFKIEELIGEGAFAKVYRAHQESLERDVALKVTPDMGQEAKTMSRLVHDSIVTVYSETVYEDRGLRVIAMQLVEGAPLDRWIQEASGISLGQGGSAEIIRWLDQQWDQAPPMDAAAHAQRNLIQSMTYLDYVLWFGARLAEALDYAHRHQVLHLDVKPANILINRSGRPMLMDFNVSTTLSAEGDAELLGGTVAYMAPEHLAAFRGQDGGRVDFRSDVYSLGKILDELWGATGTSSQNHAPGASVVRPILDRATAADPEHRYRRAAEMAESLEGAREVLRIDRGMPAATWLIRGAMQRPILAILLTVLIPQIIASAINITYNSLQIVSVLSLAQQAVFSQLVLFYNAVAYPVLAGSLIFYQRDLIRALAPGRPPLLVEEERQHLRRKALGLPLWIILLAALGWLPGAILFPLGIDWLSTPLDLSVYRHFAISFTVSGMVAVTYSYVFSQLIVLRVIYPTFCVGARGITQRVGQELRTRGRIYQTVYLLAGIVPLLGAAIVIFFGRSISFGGDEGWRSFVVGLIGLGAFGFIFAMGAVRTISQTRFALMGSDSEASSR